MNRVYATPLPIRSLAQLLYKSEYISQSQCAVRARAPNGHLDLRESSTASICESAASYPTPSKFIDHRTSRSADSRMRVG